MSGLPYQGGMNSYMFDVSQYGVNMAPPSDSSGSAFDALGKLAKLIPYVGPIAGAFMNYASQQSQNLQQQTFYERYMSPKSRMHQMAEAGINPAAAAEGIAGSSAPQMNAAAPTNAYSSLAEALGNSANTALTAQEIQAGVRERDANVKNLLAGAKDLEAGAKLKESQNIGQQIENANKQALFDKTLRQMDDKHEIDAPTAHMLRNDAALSDALFTGKIQQFWLGTAQMVQDLINAEEEHNEIISRIKKNYADAALDAAYIGTEQEKQLNLQKDREIMEEDRRYKAFRRNMISQYHYDPESTTEQNIAFALSIGDIQAATYWAHTLGRYQSRVQGWSAEKQGVVNQEFKGYEGLLGFCKMMGAGLIATEFVGSKGAAESVKKTTEGIKQNTGYDPINPTITQGDLPFGQPGDYSTGVPNWPPKPLY